MTAVAIDERRLSTLPRSWLVVSAVLPLVLIVGWGVIAATRGGAGNVGPLVGQPAPNFALADLHGNPVRLEDLRGRPVILNFWGSWCASCVEEFPILRVVSEGSGQAPVVLGIVVRDTSTSASAFMARMDATWPVAMDPGEQVARAYGVYGAPASFFIDANGVVRGRQQGQLSMADVARQLTATYAAGGSR
jgi:cytochrome c biogenesis protein CcmG/thiol:disulfide interchange protein DsbE